MEFKRISEITECESAFNNCLKVWDYPNLKLILDEIYELGLLTSNKEEIIGHLKELKKTKLGGL